MPNLLYCIGLPRSGKSTICTKWANEKPMRAIVNSDSIRLALTGQRYEPLAETQVFATKHIMIRALLERGFDVIVDGTHSTEVSIQRLLEIDENALAIPINTDINDCVKRAVFTNQVNLMPSINRIHKNLIDLGFYNGELYYNILKIKQKVIDRNLYGKFGETNG